MSEAKSGGLPEIVPFLAGVAGIVVVFILAVMATSVPDAQAVASPVLCPAGQQFTNESSKCQTDNDSEGMCLNFYCTDTQGQNRFPWRLLPVCAVGFLLPLTAFSALSGVIKWLGSGRASPE